MADGLTPSALAEIRQRLARAETISERYSDESYSWADAWLDTDPFMLRNLAEDVPALLAEIDRLRQLGDALADAAHALTLIAARDDIDRLVRRAAGDDTHVKQMHWRAHFVEPRGSASGPASQ